ncbi:hypothetical protein IQ287_24605 [Burkholderia sp. R-69927]|nr:hypothetical protein [Burkholderia sp. R-69927]MBK5183471.1 hypothetical protein [Burkholderia sp. R-69749]
MPATSVKSKVSWLVRLLPAATWLRVLKGASLRADVLAGITLAAYLLPAGVADASLANRPPEAGLYACLFSRGCSSGFSAVLTTHRSPSLQRSRYSWAHRWAQSRAEMSPVLAHSQPARHSW